MPATPPLVCLVDPDPDTRRKLRTLVRTLAAELAVYDTAAQFLAALAARRPACLIADTRLPNMSALTLLAELDARGIRIPTILLSSVDDVPAAVAAMRAGALDCIEKPYIERALASRLAEVLDRNARPH